MYFESTFDGLRLLLHVNVEVLDDGIRCRSRIDIGVVDWCERYVELVEKCFSYPKAQVSHIDISILRLFSVHTQLNPLNTDIRRLHGAISYINMMSPPTFWKQNHVFNNWSST